MSGRAAGRGLRKPGRAAGAVRPEPHARARVRTRMAAEPKRSTAEASPEAQIESAALTVESVVEAAAVPVHDERQGRSVEVYVVLNPASTDTAEEITGAVERKTGRTARPKCVWVVPAMPKNRSGRIMRHILAGVSNFTDVGDPASLPQPEIVEQIRQQVQTAKLARGETPAELTPQQIDEIRAFGQSD